jgi:predicted SAM-dependent methyltransferase
LPGWLNTDIEPGPAEVYLDATQRFPFADGTVQYIFGEQLIEHLTFEDGLEMLRECHRVLAPGGKLRLATPDLDRLVALFQDRKSDEVQGYLRGKLAWHGWPDSTSPETVILNMELRDFGHEFVYDSKTLEGRFREAGFQTVRVLRAGEADDPVLTGIEARHLPSFPEHLLNDYETMVLEGVR